MRKPFGRHNIYSKAHGGLAERQLVGSGEAPVGGHIHPTALELLGQGFAERFHVFVRKGESCWLWMAGKDKDGYGQIARRGGLTPIKAHRAAWILAHGAITSAQHVLHKCDNPPCVNPDHLFLGDQAANMKDAAAKGRLRGNRTRVLSAEDEQEILGIYHEHYPRRLPKGLRDQLARRYGVHPCYISMLGRGLRIRAQGSA